jgi:hypothetical protein
MPQDPDLVDLDGKLSSTAVTTQSPQSIVQVYLLERSAVFKGLADLRQKVRCRAQIYALR